MIVASRGTRFGWRFPAAALAAALVPLISGCETPMAPPPSAALRQQLHDAALVTPAAAGKTGSVAVPAGSSGAAAGAGAAEMGAVALGAALAPCAAGPFGCALGLAVAAGAIVVTPVAAVVGAMRAHGEDAVRAADANIRAALADAQPNAVLARELMTAAQQAASVQLLTTPASGTADDGPGAHVMPAGVTLTVSIVEVGFRSAGLIEPDVTMVMKATARISPVGGGSDLYERTWGYKGMERPYFDLAANNAAMLRAEIQTACRMMAQKIVEDLFVSTKPEPIEREPSESGRVWTVNAKAPEASAATAAPATASSASAQPAPAPAAPKPAGEVPATKPPFPIYCPPNERAEFTRCL